MQEHQSSPNIEHAIVARIVRGIFGLIGLSLIFFLWSEPFDAFGSPPLFFRVFASFIGLIFVVVGVAGAFGLRARARQAVRSQPSASGSAPRVGYECSNCGAKLDSGADVSPSGDVKCTFCARWFNIHRA